MFLESSTLSPATVCTSIRYHYFLNEVPYDKNASMCVCDNDGNLLATYVARPNPSCKSWTIDHTDFIELNKLVWENGGIVFNFTYENEPVKHILIRFEDLSTFTSFLNTPGNFHEDNAEGKFSYFGVEFEGTYEKQHSYDACASHPMINHGICLLDDVYHTSSLRYITGAKKLPSDNSGMMPKLDLSGYEKLEKPLKFDCGYTRILDPYGLVTKTVETVYSGVADLIPKQVILELLHHGLLIEDKPLVSVC